MGRLLAMVGLAVLLADLGSYDFAGGRVPLWLKVFHALFLGVLVPVCWRCYGPANFLWFREAKVEFFR